MTGNTTRLDSEIAAHEAPQLPTESAPSTATEIGPLPEDSIVILPVRNMVLFPGIVVPIAIGRERSIAAAQYAIKKEKPVGIVMQRDPQVQSPGVADLCTVGHSAFILPPFCLLYPFYPSHEYKG